MKHPFPLLYFVIVASSAAHGELLYEAEHGKLCGKTRVAHEHKDGTGRAFVTGFEKPGDGVDITVQSNGDGYYFLDLRYACEVSKNVPVTVNGSMQGSRRFSQTNGFAEGRYGRVFLHAGDNTIGIGTDWGYADIDSIRISSAEAPASFQLAKAPVYPQASPEARRLFDSFIREFGRRTFAGQHESDSRCPARLEQLASLTGGSAPAILGLDMQLYSQAWTNPEGIGTIERALDWAKNRHGIVTLSWHWLSPFGGADPVWSSFSADKTTFDVSRIADKSSDEYAAVLRDLDRIAEKLTILRDAHVPVLWRPLHEAEVGGFWWGAKGAETTKLLYRLMFDRFTRVHRLDNLLWVWTTTDNDRSLDWYPGDDCVDIVAADLYSPPGVRGDYFTVFDRLREIYGGSKPISLGECGGIPEITERAPWLWFLVWDDHITRPDFNPPSLIAERYRDPRVIVLPDAFDRRTNLER